MTDPAATHPFDRALALSGDGDTRTGHTSAAYANMVGPFGGVTAATILRAIEQHPDRHGDPLALTVNYAGPLADGEFDVTARAARTNRSNQHWVVELTQGDAVAATATAVFGPHRETWADTELPMPSAPSPEAVSPTRFPDFIVWAQQYDMRFVTGNVPSEGDGPAADSTSTLWVRDEPPRPLDFAALAALCDVFYPRIMRRHGGLVPAGTVSFTVYFHADAAEVAAVGTDFVLATARAQRFSAGYFDQAASVWSQDGTLLATSHQLVYFKA